MLEPLTWKPIPAEVNQLWEEEEEEEGGGGGGRGGEWSIDVGS